MGESPVEYVTIQQRFAPEKRQGPRQQATCTQPHSSSISEVGEGLRHRYLGQVREHPKNVDGSVGILPARDKSQPATSLPVEGGYER
jgi:hypothetical protein